MTSLKHRSALVLLVAAAGVWAFSSGSALGTQEVSPPSAQKLEKEKAMQIQYLEIVTPDLDETCAALEELHGIEFGEPVPAFGNARTASLTSGGRIGVRAPMRETEAPVVRPYVLVDDIEAAVEKAAEAGAEIAMPAMPIPGEGKFAIYIHGGIQYGLWEL